MMNMRKIWLVPIVGLIALGGSTAVVVAETGGNGPDPTIPPSGTVTVAPVGDVSGVAFLAPFRNAQDAQDRAIPDPDVVRETTNGGNPDLARFAQTTAEGERLWLVPANGGVCLTSDQHVARGCGTEQQVEQGADVTAVVCSPYLDASQLEVSGVMPDGVDAVTVDHADGSTAVVKVVNNVFTYRTLRSGSLPTTLRYDDGSGAHQVSTEVPPDAADGRCAGRILG